MTSMHSMTQTELIHEIKRSNAVCTEMKKHLNVFKSVCIDLGISNTYRASVVGPSDVCHIALYQFTYYVNLVYRDLSISIFHQNYREGEILKRHFFMLGNRAHFSNDAKNNSDITIFYEPVEMRSVREQKGPKKPGMVYYLHHLID